MTTKLSTTLQVNMLGMRMAMAFTKFTSTPLRAFGLCSAVGCARIEVFPKKSCLSI